MKTNLSHLQIHKILLKFTMKNAFFTYEFLVAVIIQDSAVYLHKNPFLFHLQKQ